MTQPFAAQEVRVRKMSVGDIPLVHAIDVQSFSLPWTERTYRFEVTENANSSAWVAEVRSLDGKFEICGMVVNWIILDELHIATLAVHPNFRRLHIAQQLLAHSMLEAWNRGARMSFLEVRRGNSSAQALYERFGFVVVGVRPRYYKDNNEDALLMTLEKMNPENLKLLKEVPQVSTSQSDDGQS